MDRRLIGILILPLLFSSICLAQGENLNAKCVVGSDNTGLVIYYEGKERLAAGEPDFQSHPVLFQSYSRSRGWFRFAAGTDTTVVDIESGESGNVVSLFLSPDGMRPDSGSDFVGLFFRSVPGFKKGVAFWRYGPHGPWTEPVRIDTITEIEHQDVQFFYWQYDDGVYGAAMPLSGEGYVTTLGRRFGKFGSKSVSYYSGMKSGRIPQMAIGFGRDPYKLFAELYRDGLESIGKSVDLVSRKSYPEILDAIGWCSWNASVYGKKLNENLLVSAAKDYADAHFPMKWFLIDDGWFNDTKGELNSFRPDSTRFPGGFKPVIDRLKKEYHIDHVGVWHALNGYWNGINPDSPLGKEFGQYLFYWPSDPKYAADRHYFIKPDSKGVTEFYNDFHEYLAGQGVSFVKVDNQDVTQWLAPGNFPIFTGAEEIHRALNASVARYFHNTIINCMDMTPDAYLNFGSTSVARAEDDYGPEYDTLHTKNFWFQRAGQHILQEVYNSTYFSQMVYPDYDMFESVNPAAPIYAIAHAINDGPTYITDKVGQHNFSVLEPLVYSDGTLIRAERAPMPTEDCLFNVDAPKPLKTFSMDKKAGLLGVWNCVDSNGVSGSFKPSDVNGIKGDRFAVYEYFSKSLAMVGRNEPVHFSLGGYGYKLYYVIPLTDGNAVIGLVNKYNAPAAVVQSEVNAHEIVAVLHQGGEFAAEVTDMPASVKVNGKDSAFIYNHHLLTVYIPVSGDEGHVKIEIKL